MTASKSPANHATIHRLNMPIMRSKYMALMPMAMLIPFEARAIRNHGQTLERLAERGGLATSEALAIMDNLPWGSVKVCEANDLLLLRRVEAYYHGVQATLPGVQP